MKALQLVMSKIFVVLILVSVQNLVFLQSSQASISSEVDSQESSLEFASAYKAANETTYTLTDVAKHSSRTDCWTIVNEVVYNITPYVNSHPGGSSSISKICGVNGTAIFNNIHGGSATQANILANYKIGVLAKPISRTCTAGNFFSTSLSKCTPAPKGFFVTALSSAAGVNSATACPASYTTLATGSTQSSDCYKPMAQTITGFSAPKAMKYKAVSYLPITTNTKAIATAKTTGACSVQAVNVVTTVKGKKVTTRKLKVTASTKAGICKITLTSPAQEKYLGLAMTVQIKVTQTLR